MKKPDGVIAIAVYYLFIALLFLIGSCAVLFSLVAAVSYTYDPVGAMWAAFGIGVGLLFCLVFLIGSVMAGWGLLNLKHWGRWAAIILAGIQLLGFPIFTIIGGFIIYYLLRADVVAAFDEAPAAPVFEAVDVSDEPATDIGETVDVSEEPVVDETTE